MVWLLIQASRRGWNSAPRLLLSFDMKSNTLQPTKQTFTHRSEPDLTVKVKMRCMLVSRAGSRWCCSLKHLLTDTFNDPIRLSLDKKKTWNRIQKTVLHFVYYRIQYHTYRCRDKLCCFHAVVVTFALMMARFVCNNWTVRGRLVSYRRGHQGTIRFMRKT